MTIAVTGATGQLGSLVIDSLLDGTALGKVAAGDVVAIVRDAAKAQSLADRGVDVRVAPYDDRAALEAALAGVDKLLLISGNEVGQRLAQHTNIIDAAVANNVSLLAYTSVSAVETSTLPVAPDHLATEQYLRSTNLNHVSLRNGWYHENYVPAVATARQTGTVLTSAGDGLVASASRADFAEAAAVVLLTDAPLEAVYELSGDTAWSQADLAATIQDVIGSDVTLTQVTTEEHLAALTAAGVPDVWADFAASTDASIKAGELSATTDELSRLIGRPTTPLAQTLQANA